MKILYKKFLIFFLIIVVLGFAGPWIYSLVFYSNLDGLGLGILDNSFYLKAEMQVEAYPFRNLEEPSPKINAQIVLVADIDSGFVFFQKNANLRRPIASVSKLMSSLVFRKYIDQETKIEIQPDFLKIEGDRNTLLQKGEILSASDLEKMMLLSSSNKAAVALSSALKKEEFVSYMNQTAQNLNMTQTKFEEPTGLSMANQSTADDLKKLAGYILTQRPEIFTLTQEEKISVQGELGEKIVRHEIKNINLFSQRPKFLEELNVSYLGGKTGFTDEARETYVGLFSVPSQKNIEKNRRILVILLYSDTRYGDAENLLKWLQKAYVF